MSKLWAKVRRNAPDEIIEGDSEADPDPELDTHQHIAAVRQGNRRGYGRLFMGALAALGIVAAIPRSISPIPLMATAKWEEIDHRYGLDKKEIEWRAELQKMADENRYEELDISEFFENLQLLAWGVDPDSVEKEREIGHAILEDMRQRRMTGVPNKDIIILLAQNIADMPHQPEQNSSAYLIAREKIGGEIGGNCFARFAVMTSLLAKYAPWYTKFMRMDLRKWEEYGEMRAHVALYINGAVLNPGRRVPSEMSDDWYILDRGTLSKAKHPPSHQDVPIKQALVDGFLDPNSIWTQKKVWIPTDRSAPPEHEVPMTVFDKKRELSSIAPPVGEEYFRFTSSDGKEFSVKVDELEGGRLVIEEILITSTDKDGIANEVTSKQVVYGGPKIAACYDTAWKLIDPIGEEVPGYTTFQLLEGQRLREPSVDERRGLLVGAWHVEIIGESLDDPNRINGSMIFGNLIAVRHERKFTCVMEDTEEERTLTRTSSELQGEIPQGSTWIVTEFIMEDAPSEATPLGETPWDKR